ncbi:MAG: YdcF family protein [Bacteroidetes bacterium]|nr:YdcF family protein [Bacteroidota bacterium]
MFFILSKILAFLIAPYTWVFFGVLFLLKKLWQTPYKKWMLGLTIFMYVISNSFLVDEVVRAWEYSDHDIYLKNTKYDLAIVLGGMGRIDERQHRFDFGYSGDRLFQTLELYYKKRVRKLLITGGSGSIRKPQHREAAYIKKYLEAIAIPDSNIIIENDSKNTYENAIFTKRILDSIQFKGSILLVTSSFHMRRSLAIFEKAGYKNITPYVTNKITGLRKFEFDYCFIPNVEAIFSLNLILHEVIGYITYKAKGYL